jgi:hypothetical protein
MLRVHTLSVPTEVVALKLFRDEAYQYLVSETVRASLLTVPFEPSVSISIQKATPLPASSFGDAHFRPKPGGKAWVVESGVHGLGVPSRSVFQV